MATIPARRGTDGPLTGVRVLDLSRVVSGPLCGRMLADLGADVVKVESPDGDVTRTARPEVNGVSPYFAQMNAGKRNICLDLKNPAAIDVVRRLASESDVLLENYRPGVLDRMGLGPTSLREINPRLVVCSISGWGQDGPWSDRKAYAPLVHAQAGLLDMIARYRDRPAEQEVQIHGDVYAAVLAAGGILAALYQRESTGEGQHIDVSMAEALLYTNEWAGVELQRQPGRGGQQEPTDRGRFDIWNHPVFFVADGSQVALVGGATSLLSSIVSVLGSDPAVLDDERLDEGRSFAVRNTYARSVIADLLVVIPDAATLQATFSQQQRVMFAEVRSVADLAVSPWARHRGAVTEVLPGMALPTGPWRSDGAAIGVTGPPPRRGQHGAELLRELGIDEAGIEFLVAEGALYI